MAFGVGGSVLQNPPRIVRAAHRAGLQAAVSPLGGLSRLFGPRGWTEFAKSALKLGAVGARRRGARRRRSALALVEAMFVDVAGAAAAAAVALRRRDDGGRRWRSLVIAGADFTWTRIHWRRDQRMSRHEVKEEVKQAEGDRMLKARLRSLRLDRSRRNMMKNVPKATMVVVNPTHYAVAMRYVRSEGGAPMVLAKGVDLIALKIREIAFEHEIPVIEDKPLARSLYDAVDGRRGHPGRVLPRGRRDRASHPIQARRLAAQPTEAQLTPIVRGRTGPRRARARARRRDRRRRDRTAARRSRPSSSCWCAASRRPTSPISSIPPANCSSRRARCATGLSADCALGWGSPPSVSLDMEFRHDRVTAFFRLILGGAARGGGDRRGLRSTTSATTGRAPPSGCATRSPPQGCREADAADARRGRRPARRSALAAAGARGPRRLSRRGARRGAAAHAAAIGEDSRRRRRVRLRGDDPGRAPSSACGCCWRATAACRRGSACMSI